MRRERKIHGLTYLNVFIIFILSLNTTAAKAAVGAKKDHSSLLTSKAQEFAYDPLHKITTTIGRKSHTRISFPPYRIKEVIGDNNKYKLINDSYGANIFILPKASALEKIDLSIITSGGKTQDLSLTVDNSEGKVILIHDQLSLNINNKHNTTFNKLEEAKRLLKVMIRGEKGKYDVTDFRKNGNRHSNKRDKAALIVPNNIDPSKLISSLEIRESKLYRYNLADLKGIVLTVKNIGKSAINIHESILDEIFAGTMLVSIDNNSNELLPGTSVTGYVVIEEKDKEQ